MTSFHSTPEPAGFIYFMVFLNNIFSIAMFLNKDRRITRMYRVFRSEWYNKKFQKLSNAEQGRVAKFEQQLKIGPYTGKPLSYTFFREKKFDGKRLLFLVYEEFKVIFLVTITDKKAQQREIDLIQTHLDVYKETVENLMKRL